MSTAAAILLALLVALTWLGCLGFARLRAPLDRLHCANFINAAAGITVITLGFATDGASVRAFKIVLVVAINLLAGAALSHAIGRSQINRAVARASEARP